MILAADYPFLDGSRDSSTVASVEKDRSKTDASTSRRPLSDEQLAELLDLVKECDSVELKLTVPESDHRSAVTALGMDPIDAQIRQVFFFDTPDLTLNKHGVVVRARRVQRREMTRW